MTVKKTTTAKKTSSSSSATKAARTRASSKKVLNLNEKLNQVIESINQEDKKIVLTSDDGSQALYTPVKTRVLETRKIFGFDIKILTSLLSSNENGTSALFKAEVSIKNDKGEWELVSTGHSQENKSSSATNAINYLENAETSSIGRALSHLGIDGGSTTETELLKQFTNKGVKEFGGKTKTQEPKINSEQIKKIKELVSKDPNYTIENILKENKISKLEHMTFKRAKEIIMLLDDDSLL